MKTYKSFFILGLSLLLSTMSFAKDGYLVILKSFPKPTVQQGELIEKEFIRLTKKGFSPYFIKTSDYPPLRKGLWAIVLGEFDKDTAIVKQQSVKRWISDSYIRKVALPKLKPMGKGFVYTNTYFGMDDCFTVWKKPEQAGAGGDYCVGKQGFHVDMVYGDARAYLNINGEEFQGENWMGSEDFPYFAPSYPLTWIYHKNNPQQPIAVSMVIVTTDVDGNHHEARYLIKINGKKFTPIKRKLPVDELGALTQYLHINP